MNTGHHYELEEFRDTVRGQTGYTMIAEDGTRTDCHFITDDERDTYDSPSDIIDTLRSELRSKQLSKRNP